MGCVGTYQIHFIVPVNADIMEHIVKMVRRLLSHRFTNLVLYISKSYILQVVFGMNTMIIYLTDETVSHFKHESKPDIPKEEMGITHSGWNNPSIKKTTKISTPEIQNLDEHSFLL